MTTYNYIISFIGELIALGLITPLTEHILFNNLDYDQWEYWMRLFPYFVYGFTLLILCIKAMWLQTNIKLILMLNYAIGLCISTFLFLFGISDASLVTCAKSDVCLLKDWGYSDDDWWKSFLFILGFALLISSQITSLRTLMEPATLGQQEKDLSWIDIAPKIMDSTENEQETGQSKQKSMKLSQVLNTDASQSEGIEKTSRKVTFVPNTPDQAYASDPSRYERPTQFDYHQRRKENRRQTSEHEKPSLLPDESDIRRQQNRRRSDNLNDYSVKTDNVNDISVKRVIA